MSYEPFLPRVVALVFLGLLAAVPGPAQAQTSVVTRSVAPLAPKIANVGIRSWLFRAPMYGCVISGNQPPNSRVLREPGIRSGSPPSRRNSEAGVAWITSS